MQASSATAREAVRALRADRRVLAVCLLGSFARGDADRMSDIDLMVLIEEGDAATRRWIRQLLPRRIGAHRVQAYVLTAPRLRDMFSTRTVFAAHIANEADVVFDRRKALRRICATFPPGTPVEETGERLRRRYRVYEDPSWCQGEYLLCFADLYSFGRSGAILGLARRGEMVFKRDAPLRRYGELRPELASSVDVLCTLEPFYLLARRNVDVSLPFPSSGSHAEAVAAA
jgi:predicted nucleotidyltransferase